MPSSFCMAEWCWSMILIHLVKKSDDHQQKRGGSLLVSYLVHSQVVFLHFRNHLNHLFYLNAKLTSQYNIQPKISYPANSFCKLNLPYNNIILWECITLKKWFYSIALTLHCIEIHILLCRDSTTHKRCSLVVMASWTKPKQLWMLPNRTLSYIQSKAVQFNSKAWTQNQSKTCPSTARFGLLLFKWFYVCLYVLISC